MAYTLPTFNLECNIWGNNRWPSDGAPDLENYPCQKWIGSRQYNDITPPTSAGYWQFWQGPIIIRFPLDPMFQPPWTSWGIGCFECPSGSGQYYRIVWTDIMHEGFPNQYGFSVVTQCQQNGDAINPYPS